MPPEIASALAAPLDLILVREIGVPQQPELAMGAVVDGGAPLIVRNEDVIALANVCESEFKAVCDRELAEIERRRTRYLGDRERVDVAGRTAVIVDDGIATGATIRAALRATRLRKPATGAGGAGGAHGHHHATSSRGRRCRLPRGARVFRCHRYYTVFGRSRIKR